MCSLAASLYVLDLKNWKEKKNNDKIIKFMREQKPQTDMLLSPGPTEHATSPWLKKLTIPDAARLYKGRNKVGDRSQYKISHVQSFEHAQD